MTLPFGITGLGAEIIDVDVKRGDVFNEEELVLNIGAQGITKRAAIRAARQEASALIPIRQQQVNFTRKSKKLGILTNRYIVQIEHNNPGGKY